MNIAIIGTGMIGGGLCKAWMRKGHRIFLGTRNPLSDHVRALVQMDEELVSAHAPEVAASKAEVILLAVPADQAFDAVRLLGDTGNKVLIDAMNAVFRKPAGFDSTGDAIRANGNDHIVKAFNMIGAENMDNPHYGDTVADLFICGEYPEDKKIVLGLAEDAGFRAFDLGGPELEPVLENLALVWGKLAFGAGLGRNIAFKVLQS
ncbi:MAG: NAD(P)-binding domain-containing protein [Bacteroidetes bacterium]|nr:NAD(P)-binding domain-containing protein [Bacteroidota bacterium]